MIPVYTTPNQTQHLSSSCLHVIMTWRKCHMISSEISSEQHGGQWEIVGEDKGHKKKLIDFVDFREVSRL